MRQILVTNKFMPGFNQTPTSVILLIHVGYVQLQVMMKLKANFPYYCQISFSKSNIVIFVDRKSLFIPLNLLFLVGEQNKCRLVFILFNQTDKFYFQKDSNKFESKP